MNSDHSENPHSGPRLESALPGNLEVPYDAAAEQCVLACALADDTGGAVVIAGQCGIRPASFYSPAAGLLWTHLEQLVKDRAPIDSESLGRRLHERGDLEKIGDWWGFVNMTGKVVPTKNMRHYAELVVLYWRRRHAMRLGAELRENAATSADREEFEKNCGELGRKLVTLGQRAETRSLGEAINDIAADVAARSKGTEDRSKWVYTGLKSFDARLKPLNSAREDGYTVIGGASGDGKSALMRQFGLAALKARQKVVFINRETSTDGCIEQLAALESGLNLLEPERALHETLAAFQDACVRMRDEWADKYLFCYQHTSTAPLITIEDLEMRIRQHCWTYGVPTEIDVDYIQLFGTSDRRCRSREEVVAKVSHGLQNLQRELGCLVKANAQLNESGLKEMRAVKRDEHDKVIHRLPGPGDFRESQAIYHDADRVIAIYRPPVDSRDMDQTGPNVLKPEQWLCQIKRRKGGTGVVKCRFDKTVTKFMELYPGDDYETPSATPAPGVPPSGSFRKMFPSTGQAKAQFRKERSGQ